MPRRASVSLLSCKTLILPGTLSSEGGSGDADTPDAVGIQDLASCASRARRAVLSPARPGSVSGL
jgi:hypothetical protein